MHPLLRKILDLFTPRGVLKSEKKGITMIIIIINNNNKKDLSFASYHQ